MASDVDHLFDNDLSDHDAIRQVAARYSRGVDRLDGDLMKTAYWPEATDNHGVFIGSGWDLCDQVVRTHARFTSTMHCVMNHAIEVDATAGTGSGEVYKVTYLFRTENGDEIVETWWGRYLDQYERRNGEWRILHRICVHEFTRSDVVTSRMSIDAAKFRQGSADRGNNSQLGR